MTTFDAQFQWECESLHREARRVWGRRFLGRKLQATLAGGTEVTGYSDYVVGDDPRYIDWNVCARHDELRTKQFQGSDDNRVYLLLDVSPSMHPAGSGKLDFARRLTAALAYLALANLDDVGVASFTDRIVQEFPPARGMPHLPGLLNFAAQLESDGNATDLAAAVEAFNRRGRRPGLVVLLSDFFDRTGFEPAVDLLRRRGHEPYLVQVVDRDDLEGGPPGPVRFTDAESGAALSVTLEAADVARYREVFAGFTAALARYADRYDIGYAQVASDDAIHRCVYQIFGIAASRMVTQYAQQ